MHRKILINFDKIKVRIKLGLNLLFSTNSLKFFLSNHTAFEGSIILEDRKLTLLIVPSIRKTETTGRSKRSFKTYSHMNIFKFKSGREGQTHK